MSAVKIIEDDSLRVTPSGFEIKVRYRWYRTLPLSCMEYLELAVDGEPVDRECIRFAINGKSYELHEMADLVEEYWFILDAATLQVELPGRIRPGQPHRLDLSLGMRAPYIRTGPGRFLTIINRYSTTQVAA